jgi:serine/threonine-protein kinase
VKRCPSCSANCWDTHQFCPVCGGDVRNTTPVSGDPYLGVTFAGKYRVIELIGAGAMGRVYRAEHLSLQTEVAVKLLDPDVASDEQTAKRFHHEARAASRLHHPNAVAVLDFGRAQTGELFLVMEFLRGRTLGEILPREAPLSPTRIAHLLGEALSALDEAHAAGLVHRDFKPDNILVETMRSGIEHVKVLDFGIAKLRGADDPQLTSAGAVCGTPDYMSPEQIRGEELDGRSDVYAAGVVLYEMLTGERPFMTGTAVIETLMAHLNQPVEPPSSRRRDLAVPPALEAVCMKALAKKRDDRHRSAAELREALQLALSPVSGERCPGCGAPLTNSARFCAECGTPLGARPADVAQAATMAVPDVAAAQLLPGSLPVGLPPPPRTPSRSSLATRLPLIDRRDLLARLDGAPSAVLLVGPPGVGKSWLLDELARADETRGAKVLRAASDPTSSARPWYPIREALRAQLGLATQPRAEEIEAATRTSPQDRVGLLDLFGGRATTHLPPEVRRRECEAAAVNMLARFSGRILFDDIDRYDTPSRRLIARLATTPGRAAKLVISAAQSQALDVELPVVRVEPLPSTALMAPPLSLSAEEARATAGVPLYLEQALRARAEGAHAPTVAGRLDTLDRDTRAALEVAALGGAELSLPSLAQIAGVADVEVVRAKLVERGWLRAEGARFELTSPTLRQAVTQTISATRRRAIHAQLAVVFSGAGADAIVIAHHACLAGDRASSALLERAGDAARHLFDDEAARHAFHAALEFAAPALEAGEGDASAHIRVALKLAMVLQGRDEHQPARQVLDEVLTLARTRGDRTAEVKALKGLAYFASARNDPDTARTHLVDGAQVALRAGDPELLATLYLDLADVLMRQGKPDEAERELWEGVLLCTGGDGADATDGPESLWRLLLLLGQLAQRAGRRREALKCGLHALRHAKRLAASLPIARAHSLLSDVLEASGDVSSAAEHRRAAADQLRHAGDRRSTAEILLALAGLAGVEKAQARAWLLEAETLAVQVGWSEGSARSRAALRSLG